MIKRGDNAYFKKGFNLRIILFLSALFIIGILFFYYFSNITGFSVILWQPFSSQNISQAGVYINTESQYNYRDFTVARANSTLYCNNLTTLIPVLSYNWYKNDVALNINSSSLTPNNFVKGDLIYCQINGVNSTNRYILDTTIGDFSNGTFTGINLTAQPGNITLNYNVTALKETYLFLHFNENFTGATGWSNQTNDTSYYNRNVYCINMTSCPEFNSSGKINGSYKFNGSNYLQETTDVSFTTNSFSVSAWINPRVYGTNDVILSGRPNIVTASRGYILYETSTGIGFEISDTATEGLANFSNTNLANMWTYVVGVVDRENNQIKLYINGTLKDNMSIASVGSLSTVLVPFKIGIDNALTTGRFFDGHIDEVRVWNKTLNETEISNNYQKGLNNVSEQLYTYNLNETFTSQIFDLGLAPNMSKLSWYNTSIENSTIWFQTRMGNYYDEGDENAVFGWHGENAKDYIKSRTKAEVGSVQYTEGYFGQGARITGDESLYFDSRDGNLELKPYQSMTYSFWVKYVPTTSSFGQHRGFLVNAYVGDGTALKGIAIMTQTLGNHGKLVSQFYWGYDNAGLTNNNRTVVNSNDAYNNTLWQYIVVVVNRTGKLSIYVNGSLQESADISPVASWDLSTGKNFTIGNGSDTNTAVDPPQDATFDEVHIFNRALSSAEVSNLYKSYLNWGDWVNSTGVSGGYYKSSGELINYTYNGTNARYIQYKVLFNSTNANDTVVLTDVALQQSNYSVRILNSEPLNNFSLSSPSNNSQTTSTIPTFTITNVSDVDGLSNLTWDLEIYNSTAFISTNLVQSFYNLTLSEYQLNSSQQLSIRDYYWRARIFDNSTVYDNIYENYFTDWANYFKLTITSVTQAVASVSTGGTPSSETYTLTDSKKEETYKMDFNDKLEFNLNGEGHAIKVGHITKKYVDLDISSNPIKVRIYEGETKNLDIDKDYHYDIQIRLEKIEFEYGKVSLKVKYLNGKIVGRKIIRNLDDENRTEGENPVQESSSKQELPKVSNRNRLREIFFSTLILLVIILIIKLIHKKLFRKDF